MPETITVVDLISAPAASGPSWPARELVGRSAAIARTQDLVCRAALAEGGVLLLAPRGADVDSVARGLHEQASRPSGVFQRVDCAAADPSRLERLLFGAAPAVIPADLEWAARDSRIAAARGGTLFLKDVTDLPAFLQARIARVARDGEVRIDGEPVATDIRWIASAASASGNGAPGIDSDVQAGRFRGDLHRRLAASRIDLPPLGERAEDVPLLSVRLLEEWCAAGGRGPRAFTQPALALLSALTWPGNLAELQMVVERAAADAAQDAIQIEDVLAALKLDTLERLEKAPARFVPSGSLRDARLRFERDYIAGVLQHHGWRMGEAARALGIQRPNLYRKARQLGIPLVRTSE
jgi:two-component system nitrogen regulation response regulator NtrX